MSRDSTAHRSAGGGVALLACMLIGGCSLPGRESVPPPRIYLLQDMPGDAVVAEDDACLTLRIAAPGSAPGFDTARMAYTEEPAELRYFAWHGWADTPARMLGVLAEQRLDARRIFARVVSGTPDVSTDLRLELDHVRLLLSIRGESADVRLSAKIRLVDLHARRVIAERTVEFAAPAAAAAPAAGAAAAQQATVQFLDGLEKFFETAELPDCPPSEA